MNEVICPACHQLCEISDYYCRNCGKNLREVPPVSSVTNQILLYAGSVLLPPLGFFWGMKYMRQTDPKLKTIGYVAAGLTVISLVIGIRAAVMVVNDVNRQVSEQMEMYQGF